MIPVSRDLLSPVGPKNCGQSSPTLRVQSDARLLVLAGVAIGATAVDGSSAEALQLVKEMPHNATMSAQILMGGRYIAAISGRRIRRDFASGFARLLSHKRCPRAYHTIADRQPFLSPSLARRMISVSTKITIPDAELHFTYSRASGPGGQNVNKVSSKATMHFDVTASPSIPAEVKQRFLTKFASKLTTEGQVVIHSQEHRDQPRNAEACEEKLKSMILEVLTPPRKRKATRPTLGSKTRRLKEKKARSDIKRGRSGGREE